MASINTVIEAITADCCCGCLDRVIVEDQHGERIFCADCGNELYRKESKLSEPEPGTEIRYGMRLPIED